jgi:hypothetical protein
MSNQITGIAGASIKVLLLSALRLLIIGLSAILKLMGLVCTKIGEGIEVMIIKRHS